MSDLLERVWTAIDDELFSGKHTDNPWMSRKQQAEISAAAIKAIADWLEDYRREMAGNGFDFSIDLRNEIQKEMPNE